MSEKAKQTVDPVDFTKPIWVVFSQSGTRNSFEPFQGPDAEATAKARASEKAKRTGTKVAVFGPQTNVYAPPPKAEAQEVQLDWTASEDTGEA